MAVHVGRQLLLLSLILLLQLSLNCEARPKGDGDGDGDGDDDDSSSEETVEDSDETRRRRRDLTADYNSLAGRAGIPGLPDPATIIKVAQLFQTVGEQILPILVEAVLPPSEPTGDRYARASQLQKTILDNLEGYSNELKALS